MSDQENLTPAEQRDPHPPENKISEERNPKASKKHHEDTLGSLTWALILIWAGLVFLAANLGWLDAIRRTQVLPEGMTFINLSTWSVIFAGAGALIFIEALIQTFVPAYRTSNNGNFFLAAIFLGIGLSGIFGWDLIWPFVLIALGLSALASALLRRKD